MERPHDVARRLRRPKPSPGRTMIMAGHSRQKFVGYPISREQDASGEALINWIGERHRRRPIKAARGLERDGARSRRSCPFEDWRFDWLDVPGLIKNCPHAYEYPMVDRDPLSRWTFGRVTLIGDAAHPMYPIGSNGATQAIIDARALAGRCWRRHDARALAAYEADPAARHRRDRERSTAAMGPELPMQLVEDRAPNGYTVSTTCCRPRRARRQSRRTTSASRGSRSRR